MNTALSALVLLVACEKASRPPGLGPYADRVPVHGALVEECGLSSTGPTCVLVILDADKHELRFHPFSAHLDAPAAHTKVLTPARSAELFSLAKRVLATGNPAASTATDFSLHLAISDGSETLLVEVGGQFTDPAANELVTELISATE